MFVPFLLLPSFMKKTVQLPSQQASYVMIVLAISSIFGRFGMGVMGGYFCTVRLLKFCFLVLTILFYSWLGCRTFESLIVFALLFGAFAGGSFALSQLVGSELWGVGNLGAVFALVTLVMVPGAILSGYIAGWLHDYTGTYDSSILYAASLTTMSTVVLLGIQSSHHPPTILIVQ
jgi:OFA family oxalate/formate antiporter-like MFS transporter